MQQRIALIVASTVTAFSLVLVGGVAARMAQPSVAAPAPTPVPVSSPTPATPDTAAQQAYVQQLNAYYQQREADAQQQLTTDQQHVSIYEQRELAYQQLIKQANAQLQQAYKQIAAAQKRPRVVVQAAPTSRPAATATAAQYAVSPQSAATIALAAAPGTTLLDTPVLVNFQGTVAYEVHLDRGNVYVDANTGQVLYNAALTPTAQNSNASSANHPQVSPTQTTTGGGGGTVSGGGDDNHSSGTNDSHDSGEHDDGN